MWPGKSRAEGPLTLGDIMLHMPLRGERCIGILDMKSNLKNGSGQCPVALLRQYLNIDTLMNTRCFFGRVLGNLASIQYSGQS